MNVDLQKGVKGWAPRRSEIVAWAGEALGRYAANRELSVRLVGRAESRKLNAHYRGKDYATNVLSFPAPPLAFFLGFISLTRTTGLACFGCLVAFVFMAP